jgi:apolipoprotein N-acyltransferase
LKNNSLPFILTIFSAALLIFSFSPFNLWLLAWIALIPLFCLSEKLSLRETFAFHYLAGLIFWAYHIWWLTCVTFLGYSLLVIYLALFLGLFGLFLKLFREKTGYPLLFIAPPLWILFEFIRTYFPIIGFPWSLLGYSQWQNTSLIQISSITGVYGVSFLIVMINAAITDFICSNPEIKKFFYGTKKRSRMPSFGQGGQLRNLALSILIITMIIVLGQIVVSKEAEHSDKIKISVIQGNIAQDMKWDEEYMENIVNIYAELSIYAGKEDEISLIIWPETSYPDYVNTEGALFQKVRTLVHYLDVPLLFGAVTYQNNRDYNSALLILPDGEIKQVYNKLRLVPFAEYIPLKEFFFFLHRIIPQIGNFSKGNEYSVFELRNLKSPLRVLEENKGGQFSIPNNFAVLICFEDLFPDLARNFVSKGANFLVVITNDAHFKESSALWQHFTHSVFRAVENRRPIVRAANNGISGFIDSYGRPMKILNENGKAAGIRGYATSEFLPSSDKTFYTRFGNLFVYLNILYLGIVLIIRAKKNGKITK